MRKFFTLLFYLSLIVLTQEGYGQVHFPGGRVALSFDGNLHDPDDWGAAPMALAMLEAAGLKDQVVHVEYNNHLTQTDPDWESEMIGSLQGAANRLAYPGNIFYNIQRDLSGSVSHLSSQINESSAGNPLWIICAGPIETVYRAMAGAQASKRQYVRLVSHSRFNELHDAVNRHQGVGELKHNWDELRGEFEKEGARFYDKQYLGDQNVSNGDNDFSTPRSKWYWLRDSDNATWQWLYGRDKFSDKFDVSDAGMVYWLLSGGPDGGCKNCGWAETKALLENFKDSDDDDDDDDDDDTPKQPAATYQIPGKIEAENYAAMFGIKIENTTDRGGGENIGWIEDGDYTDYKVKVAQAGTYQVAFRVASNTEGGNVIIKKSGTTLGGATVSNTGGWQRWETVRTKVVLSAGNQTLRLQFSGNGYLFNINHLQFSEASNSGSDQTITLLPTQDAYLEDGKRHNVEELRTEQDRRISYLMFDLSDITAPIANAGLQLTVSSDPGDGIIQVQQGSHNNWTEDNLSNANKPSAKGSLGSLSGAFLSDETYTFKLMNLESKSKVTLLVMHVEGNDVAFASQENNNVSAQPKLVITTTASARTGSGGFDTDASDQIDKVVDLEDKGVSVYPNPADKYIMVSASANTTYMLISEKGSIVQEGSVGIGGRIDIQTLRRGIYYLRSFNKGATTVQKILIL